MTLTQAIKRARDRVRVVHYGRDDFVIQRYIPKMNATTESNHMDRWRAQAHAKEARIALALELYGTDDPDMHANGLAQEAGRWDAIVRDFVARGH